MTQSALPTTNAMVDLAYLSGDRLAVRMLDALTGDRMRDFQDRALMTNLARLVDRSLVRYREAREQFSLWIETRHLGNESARFRAVSAMEECITLAHRAALYASELEARGVLDPKVTPSAGDCKAVREMRDAIQHTEDRILGRRTPHISKGQPLFLSFGDRDVSLGAHTLQYDTIASVLVSLHTAAGSPID